MEKEQYRDYHIPFAASRLMKSIELLEDTFKPTGNYNKPNMSQQIFALLFSKIFQNGEGFTGPVFSIKKTNQGYLLPPKWAPIVDYFRKNNLFENIIFEQLYYDEPKSLIRCSVAPSLLITRLTEESDGWVPRTGFNHGDSFDIDEAISKAIGEFLERFPQIIYKEKNLLRASVRDLKQRKKNYLDIKNLAGFSDEQKKWRSNFEFSEDDNFLWTEGKSLFNKRVILIPAQLIFWNYSFFHNGWQEREPILREPNTSGAGGNYTLTKALLSGLYELIQRDGFLIYWLNNISPPQIDLETIEYKPLKNLIDDYQRLNLEVHFYNTTTELNIPSCVCTIFDHSGIGPKISMGAGCEMDWDKTLLRALTEAAGVASWSRQRKDSGEEYFIAENYQPYRDKNIGQLERLNLWANEKMFSHFPFFLKGKIQSLKEIKNNFPKFSSSEKELQYLIEKFKSFGKNYEIFYYEARHQVLKDLGYSSVKVIVPALVPLYLREIYAPLGARRLKEVPEKLGFKSTEEWNPWPHPFP